MQALNVAVVRAVQPKNALLPTIVHSGNVAVVSDVLPLNALLPTIVHSGNVAVARAVQL